MCMYLYAYMYACAHVCVYSYECVQMHVCERKQVYKIITATLIL